jgi:hypothetical protein
MQPNHRLPAFCVLLLALGLAACGSNPAFLPECPIGPDRAITGDLATDVVGSWRGTSQHYLDDHPMTRFLDSAGADQLWMFRADGTGHMWWASTAEGQGIEDDGELEWSTEDDQLVVEDFPPASVTVDTSTLFIHTTDDPAGNTGLLLHRCELEVPNGVRGE